MLGNHNLSVAVQAYGDVQDIAGQVQYANLTHRFDWAVGAQYVPYLYSGGYTAGYTTVNGQQLFVEEYLLERQTDASVFAIGAYPFTRADRFELQASAPALRLRSQEIRRSDYDPLTGEFLGDDKQKLDTGFDPLYLGSGLGRARARHVRLRRDQPDPRRARAPRGDADRRVDQTTRTSSPTWRVVPDARPAGDVRGPCDALRPLRLAAPRTRASARSTSATPTSSAATTRSTPSECAATRARMPRAARRSTGCSAAASSSATRSCGRRCGVSSGGASPTGRCRSRSPCSPTPASRGSAARAPKLFGGDKDLLTSVGAAARVNVFGFLVAEVSVARPFQRPGQGWVWQWSITPGF